MTVNNVETCIDQQFSRMRAAYEAHLLNLHRNAATHASSLLEKSGILDLIHGESDYALLLCFEVLRQLSHETCNGFIGTVELLQVVDEEVEELCRDEFSNGHGPGFRCDRDEGVSRKQK